MSVMTSSVVLLARVDNVDLGTGTSSTRETRSRIQMVDHHPDDEPATIIEMALEIAPDVADWSKY